MIILSESFSRNQSAEDDVYQDCYVSKRETFVELESTPPRGWTPSVLAIRRRYQSERANRLIPNENNNYMKEDANKPRCEKAYLLHENLAVVPMFPAQKKSSPSNSCGLSCLAEWSLKMLQKHDVYANIQVIRASKSTQAISATDIHPYFRPAASFNAGVSLKYIKI